MATTKPIHFTGDPEADAFLGESPLALMIGFVLDQQVTVQKAFSSPLVLAQRLGGLNAAEIAAMDPAQLEAVFREKPALHRFPANMARRTQEFCATIASEYGGDAAAVWTGARDGADLERRLLALPGIGEMKARTIIGVIAKRLGVRPQGWEEFAPLHESLGDVDSPQALQEYQAAKRARKAAYRAAQQTAERVPIELRTLKDGGQTPTEIARELATFLGAARTSLDIAVYDVRFESDAGALVLATLLSAQQRGIAIRLVYNVDHPGPIPVPPPPETRPQAIEALPIPTRAIAGIPDLMHHKFVVRDATDVWSGSTNWTDDSWSRQENVIVRVLGAPALARAFTLNLDELWERGNVEHTGRVEPRPVTLEPGIEARAWFTPEYGDALSHRVAKFLGRARQRIRIASPVLTSGPILATLVEIVNEHRCDVAGVIDETQVDEVFHQWATNGVSAWKIPLLNTVLTAAPFSGKPTIPWTPESLHNFMHAKVVVADDVTFVGSFNFSRSGERNAENVLEIHDATTADRLATFVDEVRSLYPRTTPPRFEG